MRFAVVIFICLVSCRTVGSGARVASALSDPPAAADDRDRLDPGLRVKRSGTMPCLVASFAPVYARGALYGVDFACGDSAANGRFVCATEALCTRGAATLAPAADRIDVAAGDEQGVFARSLFAMDARLAFYRDDGRCNTPVVATVAYTGGVDDEAAMAAACRAAAGEAWGAMLPGGVCKDTADGPAAEICAAEIREAIRLFVEAEAAKVP